MKTIRTAGGTTLLVAAIVILLAAGAVGAASVGRGLPGQPQGGDAAGEASAAGSVIPDGTATEVDPHAPVPVTLSPSAEAAAHAQQIADLLSRYFTAINRHDYDAWLTTVSTAQSKRDRDSWTHDYSTTYDSQIYVSDITAGDPMTVRLQFVSHQAIEFAPPDLPAECVRWDVTYQVLDEGVGLRVGLSADTPAMAAC